MGDECDEELYDNCEQVYEKMYSYRRNVSESIETKQSTSESDVRPAGMLAVEDESQVRPNGDCNKKVCLIFCFIAVANIISVAALGSSLWSTFKNDKSEESLIPLIQQNRIIDIQSQLQEVTDTLLNHKNENLYLVENLTVTIENVTNAVDFLSDVVKNITLLQQNNMNDTQSRLEEVKDRLLEVNITFSEQLGEVKTELRIHENVNDFTFENLTNDLRSTQNQFKATKDKFTIQLEEMNITFSEQLGEVKNKLLTHENKSDFTFENLSSTVRDAQNQFEATKNRLIDRLEDVNLTFSDQLGEVKNKILTHENVSDFTFENLTRTLRTTQSQCEKAKVRLTDRLEEVNFTFSEQLGEVKNQLLTHKNESDSKFENFTSTLLGTQSQFVTAEDRLTDRLEKMNISFSDQLGEVKNKLLTHENESDFTFENLTSIICDAQNQFEAVESRLTDRLEKVNVTFSNQLGEVKNKLLIHENESDFTFENLISTFHATQSQFETAEDRLTDRLEKMNITFSDQLGEVKNKLLTHENESDFTFENLTSIIRDAQNQFEATEERLTDQLEKVNLTFSNQLGEVKNKLLTHENKRDLTFENLTSTLLGTQSQFEAAEDRLVKWLDKLNITFTDQLGEVKTELLTHENESDFTFENLTSIIHDAQNHFEVTKDRLTDRLVDVNLTFSNQLEEVKNKLLTHENKSDFTFENLTSMLRTTQSQCEATKDRLTDKLEEVNVTFSNQLRQTNNSLFTHMSNSDFAFGNLSNAVGAIQDTVHLSANSSVVFSVPECGQGIWRRVIYLNMSDSSQQCPGAWRKYTYPVRSCRRPWSSTGSCASTMFSVHGTNYSKVCGRAIGYQYGVSRGFGYLQRRGIDEIYVDGISVTHGNPRSHIWTFAVGRYEYSSDSYACPCSTTSSNANPAHYVGNNYFCETGTASYPTNTVYSNDHLWDGQGCVKTYSQCECTINSPPWFSVSLPSSTTDDIEVRICGYYNTGFADTLVALLELFIDVV